MIIPKLRVSPLWSLLFTAGLFASACVAVPPPIESQYNRGVDLYDQGKYAEAIEAYKLALRVNPDDTLAKYNLAVVYQDQGKLDDAETLYREILSRTEDTNSRINLAAILHARGQFDPAVEELKAGLQANRDNPNPASVLGEYLARADKPEEAEHYFLEALKMDDKHAPTYYRLGSLHLKMGRDESGLRHLEKAVELDPEVPVYLEALANEYEHREQISEAVQAFERLSVLQPNREDLFIHLGDIYRTQKFFKEAVSRYWSALAIHPDASSVHQKLLEIYGDMSQEEIAELKKLEQENALAKNP